MFIAFGERYPHPQAFYFKGFCEIFFSKILAILASQPPFLAHSSKHLYMIQITFLDPLQCAFLFYPAFVPIFGVSINKFRNTPRECRNTQPSYNTKQGISLARISCAHVFAARKVHWTLRLSGSALRIAFSRYALSEKAGRRASKVEIRDFSP